MTLSPLTRSRSAMRAPAATVLDAFGADPPVETAEAWRTRRAPMLRAAFVQEIYGRTPETIRGRLAAAARLALAPIPGVGTVEQWTIALGEGADAPCFTMAVVLPSGPGPFPVIAVHAGMGNRAAFPGRPREVATPPSMPQVYLSWAGRHLGHLLLGRRISGPPIAEAVERGYALALFYPGEVVADRAKAAPAMLERLIGTAATEQAAPGALAVWASLFSRAADVLAGDPRFDSRRIAVWGHSRHGKAALLAGAMDERFAAVIAHQSGRYGASLTRGARGEQPRQIARTFPHWFKSGFDPGARLSVDQHALVALNAPRPLLIGAGSIDWWADNHGALAALEAAHPVYELFGAGGVSRARADARSRDFSTRLAYFERPGWHGVTSGDWRTFLAFLDAHIGARFTIPSATASDPEEDRAVAPA